VNDGRRFPFSAVVGQDDAKLALTLAAVDPLIGGVLLRGHKGSAKTTLARGLAGLIGGFTELPLGTTEDRLIGTLDVTAALTGELRFRPGLLAAANGGVLYVDEVNLLADHLVDVLLDVAVSGENLVERDGVTHRHPARFVLVGSMNPEEGELRPQLLDRFGLCVDVTAPAELGDRTAAVRRRLDHDHDGDDGLHVTADVELAARLSTVRPATSGDDVLEAASRLALVVGAEGLRADLTMCRAAAALAGLDGRAAATVDDVRRVAPLVLAHRARRSPADPPVVPPAQLADAIEQSLADGGERAPSPLPTDAPARRPQLPAPPHVTGPRGRFVRAVPAEPGAPVAALSTARALASRRTAEPDAALEAGDLRTDVRTSRATRLVVLCVDLSGSMGAPRRAAAATGAVIGLLDDAYQRRHRVALVAFHGDGAEVVLAPTTSVDVARNRLCDLRTGGATPLAAGLRTALDLIARRDDHHPLLVVLTDGRATGGQTAVEDALAVAATARRRGVEAVVVDCEDGPVRLGLARALADALGAVLVPLADGTLAGTIAAH
jgi:magnesium chelatase subunit D